MTLTQEQAKKELESQNYNQILMLNVSSRMLSEKTGTHYQPIPYELTKVTKTIDSINIPGIGVCKVLP